MSLSVRATPGERQDATVEVGEPAKRPAGRAGWPLTALLVPYPLWWALGMGTLIAFVLAVPMVVHLWRRRPVRVPPGFGIWLVFLVWVVASTAMLGVNPPGTLPALASDRIISTAFNLAGYVTIAIALLYVGNLTEAEFPRRRLVRQLGWLYLVVLGGGLLGTVAPTFQFTSLVERLLPHSVADNPFVQSLVHPSAAQVQTVLGYVSGRPSAPFGYTNVWGYVLTLLTGWFAVSWLSRRGLWRLGGVVLLAVSIVPLIYSLNRGVWVGVGVGVLVTVVWLVRNAKLAALVALVAGLVLAVALVLFSPLMGTIQDRLAHPKSDGIRSFTVSQTLEVTTYSPILGFGSTRRALGSSNGITHGRTADCANCGNPALGSTGQLWLVLIAQGFVGAALYVGFFLRTLWAYRRDRSWVGWAGVLAVILPLVYMFLYNGLVIPLLITFLSIGLLWRNDQARRGGLEPAGAGS